MIEKLDNIAWLTYAVLFFILTLILFQQCVLCHHKHMLLFAFYALFTASGLIFIVFSPAFSNLTLPWQTQEPILNQLPVYSVFLFAGIVDWQCVYLRYISVLLQNRRRWGSLHPIIVISTTADKVPIGGSGAGDAASVYSISSTPSTPTTPYMMYQFQQQQHQASLATAENNDHSNSRKDYFTNTAGSHRSIRMAVLSLLRHLHKLGTFWIYMTTILVYVIIVVVFVVCRLLLVGESGALASAICITLMAAMSVLDTMAMLCCYYTGNSSSSNSSSNSKDVLVTGQKNKRDSFMILVLMPSLFMVSMLSMLGIAWYVFASSKDLTEEENNNLVRPFSNSSNNDSLMPWILFRSFMVYAALVALLVCCMVSGRTYYLAQDLIGLNNSGNTASLINGKVSTDGFSIRERPHHYDRMNKEDSSFY